MVKSISLVILFATGCATPPVATKAGIDSIHAHLDAATQPAKAQKPAPKKAPPTRAELAARYTGLKMFTRAVCPPCHQFQADMLGLPRDKGWTMGNGPEFHVWIINVDNDPAWEDRLVPEFQFCTNGKCTLQSTGYSGDVWRVLRLHPKFPKQ